MAKDPLDEMIQFLKPQARIDLKHIALDHLLGLSGTEDGINVLLKNEKIIQSIIELTNDKVDEINKNALLLLVNVTANPTGASELIKYKPSYKNAIEIFIGYVLDQQKKDADAVCMILSNITRQENIVEECLDSFMPQLNDLLNVFVNLEYNKKGSKLHYLAPMFSNLSCSPRIRKWLTEENPYVPLLKLIPFCNYEQSVIRRGGAIGTLRNLSFDTKYHDFLLSNDLELLTYLLSPLMGNEDYPDDEMDKLPIALQYLPKEKQRDADVDIRKMIIETLNQLCAQRKGREILRDNGVYYVLREYHKWEKDPNILLACENVVDILIQKEDEVGAEDLTTVEIPEDMTEKFQKMDEEYINSVK
ncbi:protein HGH1 homolog [Vanessa atalanta]|uniref:protein HGH1 homolog n=1 Tax=Vanessa atalanta TaxID=42275 RepID=UPI001FCD9C1F|nr:protein HGH1 homolog [Vanessa atalanta]